MIAFLEHLRWQGLLALTLKFWIHAIEELKKKIPLQAERELKRFSSNLIWSQKKITIEIKIKINSKWWPSSKRALLILHLFCIRKSQLLNQCSFSDLYRFSEYWISLKSLTKTNKEKKEGLITPLEVFF